MKKIYMKTNRKVGTDAYYQEAIETGFYGVEDDGRCFKTEDGDSPEEKEQEQYLMQVADDNIFPAWDR